MSVAGVIINESHLTQFEKNSLKLLCLTNATLKSMIENKKQMSLYI